MRNITKRLRRKLSRFQAKLKMQRAINENGTELFYKEGCAPIKADMRHPSKVLKGCGYRTMQQLKDDGIEVKLLQSTPMTKGKVSANYVVTIAIFRHVIEKVKRPSIPQLFITGKKKVYRKNPKCKLYQFVNGKYVKKAA